VKSVPKIFVWRIPVSLTDLVEEYRIEFDQKTIEQLAETIPKDSLENLYNRCEETRQKLRIQDRNFSIKLFLAVMFNLLRLYWVTKTQGES